jgi:TolB-like protein/DNA-binding winged helix-turn-helix (wHTH) protein/Tfp pilus assembly protein PilF
MPPTGSPARFRFGDFELDVAGYALRRSGRPIRLERQPMDLLIMLVQRRGQLVVRDDIVDRLWGKDVFVDVETGVHTAVRKIRRALQDSPDQPVFVETVTGKGYRFIAPVSLVEAVEAVKAVEAVDAAPEPADVPLPSQPRTAPRVRVWVGALIAAIVAGLIGWASLGRGTPSSRVTIAVLPFENIGGDKDREYLATGLTEEITGSLGRVDPNRLGVVGRTSARAAKRAGKSVMEIGRELGADYIVESSIRGESGRVRITANLIRTRDQVQVWSQVYNREPTGMLGLEQELGAAIAEQIRFSLSPEQVKALARRAPRDAAAYDLYLRGLDFESQRTPPTMLKAIEYYERATKIDPTYAVAWSQLALAHAARPVNSDAAPHEVTSRAREAAQRAVAADPDLADAQFALGYVSWMLDWDWPAAETALRRAIDLDPRFATAHWVLGHLLSQMGRHSEALREVRRGRELDPLSAMPYAISSLVAFQARDNAAALDHASQAIALDQELWIGYMMRAQAYAASGQSEQAFDAIATASRLSGGNSKVPSLRGYMLGKAGRRDEARDVLTMLETLSRTRYVPPFALALVHAGLDERDEVFAWLNRALDARDVHLIYLPVDPKWDPYRSDPRFDALLARCRFTSAK